MIIPRLIVTWFGWIYNNRFKSKSAPILWVTWTDVNLAVVARDLLQSFWKTSFLWKSSTGVKENVWGLWHTKTYVCNWYTKKGNRSLPLYICDTIDITCSNLYGVYPLQWEYREYTVCSTFPGKMYFCGQLFWLYLHSVVNDR